ncbi:MAG: L,D-transpeptidase [Ignavibacteriaceae bacterium]|nr:L,D-transpeptidase [Ignavibacteriaceae bacterium]
MVLFIAGCVIYGVILNLREIPLSQAAAQKGIAKLDDTNILIDRSSYKLLLYNDTVFIKSYKANFGRNINIPKCKDGDLATPVGEYKICDIDTTSRYHIFLRIDYPNLNDAVEALRKGVITQSDFDKIKFAIDYGTCPDSNAFLGGHIGIQGIGRLNFVFKYLPFNYNWTDGSIAISNEDIDELYSVVKKGTKVVIK